MSLSSTIFFKFEDLNLLILINIKQLIVNNL